MLNSSLIGRPAGLVPVARRLVLMPPLSIPLVSLSARSHNYKRLAMMLKDWRRYRENIVVSVSLAGPPKKKKKKVADVRLSV